MVYYLKVGGHGFVSSRMRKVKINPLTRIVVALKCLFLIHLTGIKQFSATGFNQLSLTLLKFNFKLIQKLALGQMSSVEKSCGQLFVN